MSENIPPIGFSWDGEIMVPLNANYADRYYVIGETYRLVPHEERSINSHNHYFAALNEAYQNLPIEQAGLFASVEHFRKWLLIKTGYRHERVIVAADAKQARKLSTFAETVDQFAVVQVNDNVVTILTAESQSMKAMKKKRFQLSKTAVLDVAAAMIEVTREELEHNSKRAA